MAEKLHATRLIGDTIRFLFRHFSLFAMLGVAVALVQEALAQLVAPSMSSFAATEMTFGTLDLLGLVIISFVGVIGQGIVCLLTYDLTQGPHRSLQSYVTQSVRVALPLLVLTFVVGFAIGLGTLFFLIPGLYVAAMFLVTVPALMIEDLGLAALKRAQVLSAGHRWGLVGAFLIIGVFCIGIALLIVGGSTALYGLPDGDTSETSLLLIAQGIVGLLFGALMLSFGGIFSTLTYIRLREIKG